MSGRMSGLGRAGILNSRFSFAMISSALIFQNQRFSVPPPRCVNRRGEAVNIIDVSGEGSASSTKDVTYPKNLHNLQKHRFDRHK